MYVFYIWILIHFIVLLTLIDKINIEKEIIPYQIFYLSGEISKSLDLVFTSFFFLLTLYLRFFNINS